MTDPAAFFDGIIKILFVCVIITAAYIITTKNLITLVRVYSLQSLTLAVIALALYLVRGHNHPPRYRDHHAGLQGNPYPVLHRNHPGKDPDKTGH